jgi:hypothetical protein
MGHAASKPAPSSGASAAPTHASSSPSASVRPTFSVRTVESALSASLPVLLRLDSEALVVLDEATGAQIFQVFYYRILCWGYSPSQFYWKASGSGEVAQAEAQEGAGGAAASSLEEAEAKAVTYAVCTEQGKEIESHVMGSVRTLMDRMEARGVGPAEFATMLGVLTGLADDGLTDHALGMVKQMALGRAFDARQATALLQALGSISPFDKVEAACALYPQSLLHPSTFAVILADSFEDQGERDNIAHRLGLRVTLDGAIEQSATMASKVLSKHKQGQ